MWEKKKKKKHRRYFLCIRCGCLCTRTVFVLALWGFSRSIRNVWYAIMLINQTAKFNNSFRMVLVSIFYTRSTRFQNIHYVPTQQHATFPQNTDVFNFFQNSKIDTNVSFLPAVKKNNKHIPATNQNTQFCCFFLWDGRNKTKKSSNNKNKYVVVKELQPRIRVKNA